MLPSHLIKSVYILYVTHRLPTMIYEKKKRLLPQPPRAKLTPDKTSVCHSAKKAFVTVNTSG